MQKFFGKFFTIGLLLSLGALCGALLAAILTITIDGTPDAFTEAGTDTTHTSASLTVASNSYRLLFMPYGDTSTIGNNTTGDFNGDAATHVTGCYKSSGASTVGDCMILIAPDVATDAVDLVVDVSSRVLQMPISLYNVVQTSPVRDVDTESGTTATSTADLTLTTVAGDWVGSCIVVRRDAGADPGSGLAPDGGTQLEELYNSLGTRFSCAWQIATGTTTTVGWGGWTASNGWVHIAVSIAPANAAGVVTMSRRRR